MSHFALLALLSSFHRLRIYTSSDSHYHASRSLGYSPHVVIVNLGGQVVHDIDVIITSAERYRDYFHVQGSRWS